MSLSKTVSCFVTELSLIYLMSSVIFSLGRQTTDTARKSTFKYINRVNLSVIPYLEAEIYASECRDVYMAVRKSCVRFAYRHTRIVCKILKFYSPISSPLRKM